LKLSYLLALASLAGAGVACTGRTTLTLADSGSIGADDASDAQAAETGPNGACVASRPLCNLITNEGCEANRACRPLGTNGANTSCQNRGVQGWSSPCTRHTDCLPGFICSPKDFCEKLCCIGDDRSCQDTSAGGRARGVCAITYNDLTLSTCTESGCDPFVASNTGCSGSNPYCSIVDGSTEVPAGVTTLCVGFHQDPPLGEGGTCRFNNDCRLGFGCLSSTSGNSCRRNCEQRAVTGQPHACPVGYLCMGMPGATYGHCIVPP